MGLAVSRSGSSMRLNATCRSISSRSSRLPAICFRTRASTTASQPASIATPSRIARAASTTSSSASKPPSIARTQSQPPGWDSRWAAHSATTTSTIRSVRKILQLFAFFDNLEEADIDAPLPGEIGPYVKNRDEYRAKRRALLEEYNVPALQADWEKQMLEAAANPGKRTDWDLAWDCLLKLTEGGDGEKIMRIPLDRRTERDRDILTDALHSQLPFRCWPESVQRTEVRRTRQEGSKELKQTYPQISQAMTVAEAPAAKKYYLRVRGDYRTNGIEVNRNTPSVLPALAVKNSSTTRLDLARWLVSKENPLTSRVTVNWIWQEIFGRGLVKTADDFGTRGDKPSHPELLDWLAYRFIDDGWSTKRLIRTIVTSSTYRQSSNVRPDIQSKDPDNALLSRLLPAETSGRTDP